MLQFLKDSFQSLIDTFARLGSSFAEGGRWWLTGSRQIGSQMRDGLVLLWKVIIAVVLFPYTLFRALWNALKGLSRTGEIVGLYGHFGR